MRTPTVRPRCAAWPMMVSAGVSPTMTARAGATPSCAQMWSALCGSGLAMEAASSPHSTMSTSPDSDSALRNSAVPSRESDVQMAILIPVVSNTIRKVGSLCCEILVFSCNRYLAS